ncbi:TPA: proline reductase-associated electron transfer protein PrdC [Clostridioides difficile]|nr:proline reductase-associated electron transfer protein PrdC [Clostridioides difficile]
MNKLYSILLKQHVGGPDKPVVSVGDVVKKGTLIAEPTGLGANIYASVSGKISEINDQAIVIEADEVQEDTFEPLKGEGILDLIKEAGVVGMGGAGFPTHVKLNIDLNGGTILANAAECEPLLAHNIKEIEERPEIVYQGIKYAMEVTNAGKGMLAIKSKHPKAIEAFKKVIKPGDNIEVAELVDMYPMGEERAIVRDVLGKLLEPTQLPSEANAVVINVETLTRIVEAVEQKRPVISKNITVVGQLNSGKESIVFEDVPIGTTVGELIERAGGIKGEYGEIILGGPFTGKATTLDAPITKTSGGIIVTMPFVNEKRKMGLLVCACGPNEERMRDIATKMGVTDIVSVQKCKQAQEIKGALKCENPGHCPGQAQKCIEFKKAGAEVILIGNCTDCSNTVMGSAPKLKLGVYHITDHVIRTVNHPLIRRIKGDVRLKIK